MLSIDGVRRDGQPARPVHLLFSLRPQHDRALRVEESLLHDAVRQSTNLQHRSRQFVD